MLGRGAEGGGGAGRRRRRRLEAQAKGRALALFEPQLLVEPFPQRRRMEFDHLHFVLCEPLEEGVHYLSRKPTPAPSRIGRHPLDITDLGSEVARARETA